MSSDEDDHGMAFSHENDYEGGQWEDGEFYAAGKKRGKRQSKSQQIFGVFAEDSSGDDERSSVYNRSRRKQSDLRGGITFVSSSKPTVTKRPREGGSEGARAGLGCGGEGGGSHLLL